MRKLSISVFLGIFESKLHFVIEMLKNVHIIAALKKWSGIGRVSATMNPRAPYIARDIVAPLSHKQSYHITPCKNHQLNTWFATKWMHFKFSSK
jgi:hypothetical protein